MKDMRGEKCKKCNTGKYEEVDPWSDFHGTVTCSFEECRHTIERWQKEGGDLGKKKAKIDSDKKKIEELHNSVDTIGTYANLNQHASLNNKILLLIAEQLMEIKKKL